MSMSSIPVLKLICQRCGREFSVSPDHFKRLGFKHLPKRCPTCNDEIQGRPSVVVEREVLNVYDGVEIVSLPTLPWEKVSASSADDIPTYKMVIKGSIYGASWSGRIDIHTTQIPKVGDIVSIREMNSKHRTKVKIHERKTLCHGTVNIEETLPITTDDPDAYETIQSHRYLVIEPFDGEPTSKLVWAEARTKTTLKGFGRQYWAWTDGAPIASWKVKGGYRSGRAYTVGVLAIVDPDHPLYIITKGDIEEEKIYK